MKNPKSKFQLPNKIRFAFAQCKQNPNFKYQTKKVINFENWNIHWKLEISASRRGRENWKFPSFQDGFTLIEIIVSLAVVFILIGMTFAGYASLNQRQQLLSAGQTVKNILRDAQSRAGSGEVDCSICNCSSGASAVLSGWFADFTSRTIYGKCDTNIFPTPGQSFGIPAEITIVPHLTPPTVLTFKTFPPGTDQPATICFSHKNLPGQYFAIRVNKAGEINDDGTLINTCVPTP